MVVMVVCGGCLWWWWLFVVVTRGFGLVVIVGVIGFISSVSGGCGRFLVSH